MRHIYEIAGYKFRWKKKKVLTDGLNCPSCDLTLKKGQIAYIKYNRWLDAISDFCCAKCYHGNHRKKLKGGPK